MARRPVTDNTVDPRKQRLARKEEKRRRNDELEDLQSVLATESGRRFVWRMLGYCAVFESIWEPNAKIHHNAGRQDVGHFLMAEIKEADEGAFLTLMQESYARERKEDEALKAQQDDTEDETTG